MNGQPLLAQAQPLPAIPLPLPLLAQALPLPAIPLPLLPLSLALLTLPLCMPRSRGTESAWGSSYPVARAPSC